MTKPTVGELFAGIGGIGLGFERAGFEVKWANEIDPYACKVYAKNFPHVELIQEDVHVWEPEERHRVDVLTGGFPCQPVSEAGRQKAQRDPRWLWPAFKRIISHLRPGVIIIENVPGLRYAAEGKAFWEVLGNLATLGYNAEWESIPACAVGAPHQRDRIWIMAYSEDDGPRWGKQLAKSRKEARNVAYPKRQRDENDKQRTTAGTSGTMQEETQERQWFRLDSRQCHDNSRRNWSVEPNVGRVAHGVSARMDRIKGLGNAVVPQVAEVVAKAVKPWLADS